MFRTWNWSRPFRTLSRISSGAELCESAARSGQMIEHRLATALDGTVSVYPAVMVFGLENCRNRSAQEHHQRAKDQQDEDGTAKRTAAIAGQHGHRIDGG